MQLPHVGKIDSELLEKLSQNDTDKIMTLENKYIPRYHIRYFEKLAKQELKDYRKK